MFVFLNVLYKKTNHYKDSVTDITRICRLEDNSFRIVVIGSNHPKYAFDFNREDIKGANLAIGPEAFEYDFIILKKFTSHISKGAVVVIPICLLNFFLYRFDNPNTYLKYYGFLNRNEFPHYNHWGRVKAFFPLLSDPKLLRYIIYDSKEGQKSNLESNPLNDQEIKQDANNWVSGWENQFGITIPNVNLTEKNSVSITKNVEILSEIINYCMLKGFKPVVTILPVTDILYSKFSEDFIQTYVLSNINKANTRGAVVLNYLQDERFKDRALFFNSFFLNKKGRELFTDIFVGDIKRQGLYD